MAAARYFATEEPEPGEEQQVLDEFMRLGRILQVPERMPPTIDDYWKYFDRQAVRAQERLDRTLALRPM